MFKTLFATLSCLFWLFSCLSSVIYATEAKAQQADFTQLATPVLLPTMMVQDPKGNYVSLQKLIKNSARQGFVLLHLWSPSCGICAKEMKDIDAAKSALKQKRMAVISIADDSKGPHSVPAFIRRQSIDADGIYIDSNRRISRILRSPGVPMTYIVSDKGRVLAIHEGSLSW